MMRLPDDSAGSGAPPELTLVAPTRDLGGFNVRRALPSAQRRMVGHFVFLDQMGPMVFRAGEGLDVRPHPHIGLATVTYLFEGQVLHRDTLGTVQTIRPGEVNWMTAGRGIAHSERTPPEVRAAGGRVFGIQLWVALPRRHEEDAPSFSHTPASALPVIADRGIEVRLVLGSLYGGRSPVPLLSEMFYAAATLEPGARLPLGTEYVERAAYVAEGAVTVAGDSFGAATLLLFRPGDAAVIEAKERSRLLLLGGEPADGPRHMWWNFVSSSAARINAAREDWKAGRFGTIPGETEFIPLPDHPAPPVEYP